MGHSIEVRVQHSIGSSDGHGHGRGQNPVARSSSHSALHRAEASGRGHRSWAAEYPFQFLTPLHGLDEDYPLLEERCYILSTSAVFRSRVPLVSFVPTRGRSDGLNQRPTVAVVHASGNLIPPGQRHATAARYRTQSLGRASSVRFPSVKGTLKAKPAVTRTSRTRTTKVKERKKRRTRHSKNHRAENLRRKPSTLILPPSIQNPHRSGIRRRR
jgi:hypothetical protein